MPDNLNKPYRPELGPGLDIIIRQDSQIVRRLCTGGLARKDNREHRDDE